jgi:hypothetical protein
MAWAFAQTFGLDDDTRWNDYDEQESEKDEEATSRVLRTAGIPPESSGSPSRNAPSPVIHVSSLHQSRGSAVFSALNSTADALDFSAARPAQDESSAVLSQFHEWVMHSPQSTPEHTDIRSTRKSRDEAMQYSPINPAEHRGENSVLDFSLVSHDNLVAKAGAPFVRSSDHAEVPPVKTNVHRFFEKLRSAEIVAVSSKKSIEAWSQRMTAKGIPIAGSQKQYDCSQGRWPAGRLTTSTEPAQREEHVGTGAVLPLPSATSFENGGDSVPHSSVFGACISSVRMSIKLVQAEKAFPCVPRALSSTSDRDEAGDISSTIVVYSDYQKLAKELFVSRSPQKGADQRSSMHVRSIAELRHARRVQRAAACGGVINEHYHQSVRHASIATPPVQISLLAPDGRAEARHKYRSASSARTRHPHRHRNH